MTNKTFQKDSSLQIQSANIGMKYSQADQFQLLVAWNSNKIITVMMNNSS